MEKQAYKRVALGVGLALALCVALALLRPVGESTGTPQTQSAKEGLYLVYSPVCPHCHHLMGYLKGMGVNAILTTDISPVAPALERAGFSWDGGVPLLVCVADRNVVIMEGFPSSSQDVNGYFLGMEREEEICRGLKGTPVYEGGVYAYCVLPTGALLGNVRALQVVVSACEGA